MYKLSFKDKTVLLVSTELGESIKQEREKVNPKKHFEVDKNQYDLSEVKKIEFVADESTAPKLPSGPRCRAEKSIHKEIYYLYKKALAEGSKRPYREFRDKVYTFLYTKKDKWCDYKKGTCFCEGNESTQKVMGMFPGAEVI